jgi:BA14K-like protein
MPRTAFFATALLLAASSIPAYADTQAYCELYSKDFADGRTSNVDQWQLIYRGAFDDCMIQYNATPDTAPKPVAVEAPAEQAAPVEPEKPKAKPKRKVTVVAVKTTSSTSAAKAKKLVPGSDEWNTYCDAKYRSFNKQNGTYLSLKGKIRRCK